MDEEKLERIFAIERDILRSWAKVRFDLSKPYTRENFLHEVRHFVYQILINNPQLLIIQRAKWRHPEIITYVYTYLSLLHGVCRKPSPRNILDDLISCLTTDLDAEIEKVVSHAKTKAPQDIFMPELVEIWTSINDIYKRMNPAFIERSLPRNPVLMYYMHTIAISDGRPVVQISMHAVMRTMKVLKEKMDSYMFTD